MKKKFLSLLVIFTLILSVLTPAAVLAEAKTENNLETDITASGDTNGPYTFTIKATQKSYEYAASLASTDTALTLYNLINGGTQVYLLSGTQYLRVSAQRTGSGNNRRYYFTAGSGQNQVRIPSGSDTWRATHALSSDASRFYVRSTPWPADATLQVAFSSDLDLSGATASEGRISGNKLTFSGYNYAANVGNAKTITVSNVKLASSFVPSSETINAIDTSSSKVTYGSTTASFAQVQVPVGLKTPLPSFRGKTATWDAVPGAEGYDLKLTCKSNGDFSESFNYARAADNRSFSLDEFFPDHSSWRMADYDLEVTAYAGTGDSQIRSGTGKTSVRVLVVQADTKTLNYKGEVVEPTLGGSVELTMADGQPITYDTVAVGETVKLTATASDGYEFTGFKAYDDGDDPIASEDNPHTFVVNTGNLPYWHCTVTANFAEPMPMRSVTLEFGTGHGTIAQTVYDALQPVDYGSDDLIPFRQIDYYSTAIDGTKVTIACPILDRSNNEVKLKDLQSALAGDVGESLYPTMLIDDTGMKYIRVVQDPNVTSMEDIMKEITDPDSPDVADGQELFVLWAEPIDELSLTVEQPVCGSDTNTEKYPDSDEGYDLNSQTNSPKITVDENAKYELVTAGEFPKPFWGYLDLETGWDPYIGTFDVGEKYPFTAFFQPKFKYFFDPDVPVKIEGGTKVRTIDLWDSFGLIGEVSIEHKLNKTDKVPATCTEEGMKEYYTCSLCNAMFSDAKAATPIDSPEVIPATGHDYGAWEVTKEPTATEKGAKRRVCRNDPSHIETGEIPPTGEDDPTVEEFSITFDLGGGTIDGKPGPIVMKIKKGDKITMPKAPVRDGYKFRYWKGSRYNPGDTYVVTEDHTFTAVWEKNPINPEIIDNGGKSKSKTSKTTGSNTKTNTGKSPNTADSSMTLLWAALLAAALLTLLVFARRTRRR